MVLILSRSKMGSPVIQSALESAGKDQQIALIQGLRGHVIQLMLCFNGNHVLQKSFQVMSGASIDFILDELAQYPGGWSAVIKHSFGCRVAQRAIEHCTEQATEGIVSAVEAEAKVCVEHKFANYVLQSIIEHGTPSQKWRIINALIKLGIPNLTQSLIPSYVVEKTFDNGDEKCKQAIAEAILSWRGAIVHMGCNRWGSGMVKRIMDAQKILGETLYGEALQQQGGIHQNRQAQIAICQQASGMPIRRSSFAGFQQQPVELEGDLIFWRLAVEILKKERNAALESLGLHPFWV